MDAHRLAEKRSLAYHQLVAERIRRDPALVGIARARVDLWLTEGRAPYYARAWERALAGPLTDLCDLLVADTEEARALRQATPFAGAIGPRERWGLWKATRDA